MKPEYRYAVVDTVNGFRVTHYVKSKEAAHLQKEHCFRDDRYKVGKFEMKLKEVIE